MEKILVAIMAAYYLYIFGLSLFMFKVRVKALGRKEIDYNYFKDYQGNIPDHVAVVGNHFNNQFQIPVYFMIACLVSIAMKSVDQITIGLALTFVLSRILHSYIHLGKNKPITRAKSYFIGLVLVAAIFIRAAL